MPSQLSVVGESSISLLIGDCREVLPSTPAASVQTVVTSPPYWGLRDYGIAGQLGNEKTPDEYVENLVDVFRLVHRVLKDDGTVWLNLGDAIAKKKYGDVKRKDLIGLPWRVAFALRDAGWYLRSDIVWNKGDASFPESVRDRPTRSHEYVFLLSKSERYYYDISALREPAGPASMKRIQQKTFAEQTGGEKDYRNGVNPSRSMRKTLENFAKNPGRNARDVWSINTKAYKGANSAVMPEELASRCIRAGSRPGDLVLDPFGGAGTTALAARKLGRDSVSIELNPDYAQLALDRNGIGEMSA